MGLFQQQWRIRAVAGLAGLLTLLSGPALSAQTIGGAVGDHVKDGLEKPKKKKKKKKKKRKKKRKPRSSRSSSNRSGSRAPASPPPAPEEEDKGPKLPQRIFHRNFQIDPTVGVAYRGWRPQGYPDLEVRTESYFTMSLELQAMLFRVLRLHRGYYETNSIGAPRRPGVSIAAQAGKAAPKLLQVVGMLGVADVRWVLEPMIRYETRAFETRVLPKRPVRIIPRSADPDDDLTQYPLEQTSLAMESGFETFVVGAIYNHDNVPGVIDSGSKGLVPPIYFGVGFTSFNKPYQVRVGDLVLEELVFDARFQGAGAAFGFDTKRKPDRFYGSFAGQLGLGEVELMRDYTLNQALPSSWMIGYFQGEAKLGYLHPLTRGKPTLLLGAEGQLGGSTFFYFKTINRDGESSTPPLNWDILWGTRVFVTLPL